MLTLTTTQIVIILEIILLLAITVYFLWRKNQNLKNLISATTGLLPLTDNAQDGETNNYVTFLDREISTAENFLQFIEDSSGTDCEEYHKCSNRIKLLEIERSIFGDSDIHTQEQWQKYFSSLPEKEKKSDDKPENFLSEEDYLKLHQQLEIAQQNLNNLEKYKRLFLDLKDKYEILDDNNSQIIQTINHLGTDSGEYDELHNMVASLEKDKHRLKHQVSTIENEFNQVLQDISKFEAKILIGDTELANLSAMTVEERMYRIKHIVDRQKFEIRELNNVLNKTQIELKDQALIKEKFDKLSRSQREFEDVITVLEDENEFLRGQIQALLKQGLTDHENSEKNLQQQLAAGEEKFMALQKQYLELENRYLNLYEKSNK